MKADDIGALIVGVTTTSCLLWGAHSFWGWPGAAIAAYFALNVVPAIRDRR